MHTLYMLDCSEGIMLISLLLLSFPFTLLRLLSESEDKCRFFIIAVFFLLRCVSGEQSAPITSLTSDLHSFTRSFPALHHSLHRNMDLLELHVHFLKILTLTRQRLALPLKILVGLLFVGVLSAITTVLFYRLSTCYFEY